ncbi:uncharacterized protein LTR77_007819 [Saxophila tyrrhenica]|uniref:NAD-dependent epimerase/dehydratase domain-containing protein n=1 Tax=Saxophila tyrrhenica TaxID=1690608 RepID=A0AAV9P374_9PEZI|nr:hypothetical protein LTR77_007819 [Saxophila tyrrhenica]
MANTALPKESLILVTGATGFIGANTVFEALEAGFRVRGTSRSKESAAKLEASLNNHPKFASAIVPDVSQEGAWDEAVKGVDAIIHMATDTSFSPDPNVVVTATEEGVRNILRSSKKAGVKRFVLTSSSAAVLFPVSNKDITVEVNDWNQEALDAAWAPPPYTEERAFAVYAASKAAMEKAMWKFAEDEKPHFTVNSILPDFNVGRILTSGGPTGSSVEMLLNGSVPPFPNQYHIDVIDDARIHVIAAAMDPGVENERIFAFARPFQFTEMIKDLHELRPGVQTIAQPPENEGHDLSKVPNARGAELLKKWYGQDEYKTMRQSIEEALATLKV